MEKRETKSDEEGNIYTSIGGGKSRTGNHKERTGRHGDETKRVQVRAAKSGGLQKGQSGLHWLTQIIAQTL